MSTIAIIEGIVASPEQALDEYIASIVNSDSASILLPLIVVCQFQLRQYWLDDEAKHLLYAFYEISDLKPKEKVRVLLTDRYSEVQEVLGQAGTEFNLDAFAKRLLSPVISLADSIPLVSVEIPKPWGRELWYTGIEQRGVSKVSDGLNQLELPWLVAALPRRLLGAYDSLVLLKILDPLPDEVYGDLYFELHEEKQEVYIVTHIDKIAWPDGVGRIRFGFNKQKLEEYKNTGKYLQDYQLAVNDYHLVREQVDQHIDKKRQEAGFALNEPVAVAQMKSWESTLAPELVKKEFNLRRAMDDFTALQPLRVGDVVSVPLLTPHSLQHGVRTIEFQTPVYERKILSFGQKVLTQPGWDTAAALKLVQLEAVDAKPFEMISNQKGSQVERVVDFCDFEVLRVRLEADAVYQTKMEDSYSLIMVVLGEVSLGERKLGAEEAALLCTSFDKPLEAENGQEAVFLLAKPKKLQE